MVRTLAIVLIVLALAAGLWWVVNKPGAIHLAPETETTAPAEDAPAEDLTQTPTPPADEATPQGETEQGETQTTSQTAQPESAEPEAADSTQADTGDDPLTLAGFDAAAITRLVDESDISAAQKTSLKALIAEAESDESLREAVLDQVRAALQ